MKDKLEILFIFYFEEFLYFREFHKNIKTIKIFLSLNCYNKQGEGGKFFTFMLHYFLA
jgi:hypothetical protein